MTETQGGDRRRIAIVGPYPPPVGGIAVHVQRLASLLKGRFAVSVIDPYRDAGVRADVTVVPAGGLSPARLIRTALAIRRCRPAIAHFNISSMHQFLFAGHLLMMALPRGCQSFVTIHGGRWVWEYPKAGRVAQFVMRDLLKRFNRVVCVSRELAKLVVHCGVPEHRVVMLPAFLPPTAVPENSRLAILQAWRRNSRRILVSSGYGSSNYGFHLILDAVRRNPDLQERCAVVLCLYHSFDEDYIQELEELEKECAACVIVRGFSPTDFAGVLAASDIYIRATDEDGDAIAIREAASLQKQVVASDCTVRPSGSRLFRTGDAQGLAEALRATLDDARCGIVAIDVEDSSRAWLELFR